MISFSLRLPISDIDMIIGLKYFSNSMDYSLPLELCFFVYCLIVCFYIFDVSKDSSLYIAKKMLKI